MRRRPRRPAHGLTLIELLVTMTLMVIITAALGYGFTAGMDMQRRHIAMREERDRTVAMEERITRLLQGTKLSEDETDTNTYFKGESTGNDSGDLGADRLTFTTIAPEVPDTARFSEDDFETQHTAHGPVGGVAEVSLSTTAVGTPTNANAAGLFERLQRPSDGDSTQGGTEALLLSGVTRIGFQFWNGENWATTWDTTTGEHRLPAAVLVSYTMDGDSDDTVRTFTVPIPESDIDAQNPGAAANAPNSTSAPPALGGGQ